MRNFVKEVQSKMQSKAKKGIFLEKKFMLKLVFTGICLIVKTFECFSLDGNTLYCRIVKIKV